MHFSFSLRKYALYLHSHTCAYSPVQSTRSTWIVHSTFFKQSHFPTHDSLSLHFFFNFLGSNPAGAQSPGVQEKGEKKHGPAVEVQDAAGHLHGDKGVHDLPSYGCLTRSYYRFCTNLPRRSTKTMRNSSSSRPVPIQPRAQPRF